MKKILLITIQDNNNIGNRLQNYALQKILQQYGAEVTNLDCGYTSVLSFKVLIKNQIKKYLGYLGSERYAEKYRMFINTQLRCKSIAQFTKGYITDVQQVTYENVFEKNWNTYDLAIVGSDQVWHKWRSAPNELPYYYLEFMPETKRVAYAASFGFEDFPLADRSEHINGLNGMHEISCRENSGCTLVRKATGKKAIHVLDPTLLLKAKDWREIESDIFSVVTLDERFIFAYFLGDITEEYRQFIDNVVQKRGLRIINFFDMQDEAIAQCGVGEFISFIDCADYVLTDSFHCTVFSILFEKEFTVFRRKQEGFEKMYSRIEELLQSVGRTDSAYDGISSDMSCESLQELYQKSREYLEKILKCSNSGS